MSLSLGIMPKDLKLAKVTPIFKNKGTVDLPENYRPISVVAHIAKLFEKAVCKQFMSFLSSHSFITPDQTTFLKGHSTATALHKVVDDLLECTDEGLISSLCFFDIRKCFDCIPHQPLLYKLSKYGIKDIEFKWFKSYLSDRFQITSYNNVMSSPLPLTTGVPQGSVLGPCLFLLFINDLTSVVKYSAINIYADDTLIYVSDSDIVSAARKLQYDIDSIVNWFRKNKLTLSVEKTFIMFVGSRQRLQSISVFPQLTIHDKILENKESAKYLGIIMDRHLSWNDQISDICQRLRPKIGIFGRKSL